MTLRKYGLRKGKRIHKIRFAQGPWWITQNNGAIQCAPRGGFTLGENHLWSQLYVAISVLCHSSMQEVPKPESCKQMEEEPCKELGKCNNDRTHHLS